MKLPRHGLVEIETLRRYGRVPVGTRAVGSFALWTWPQAPGRTRFEVLQARIQVGDDPRVVRVTVMGDFTSGGDRPQTWHMMHRRQVRQFRAADLSEYVLEHLRHYLEDQSTSTGAQRFKVLRAEWQDDSPLPAWVDQTKIELGAAPADGP